MSENKLPCDTVRDLFPSYIDELTSETTNQLIKEHLSGCEACAGVLRSMQTPEASKPEKETKEIDFLKKNRRRNLKIIIGSLAGAVALAVIILLLKAFVIGEANYSGMVATRVEVSGSDFTLTAVPVDSIHAISDLTFEEEDGVVTVHARAVVSSFLHRGDLRRSFTASGNIRRIVLGGQIIWDDGAPVSFFTAAVFQTRHDYIGSMPDNLRTAEAVCMSRYLGAFTNELATAQKPYVWKILLETDVPTGERAARESDMERFAYVFLGVIGNLDEVEFSYTSGGELFAKTVTAQDATTFFGRSIKDCGSSPRVLGDLLNRTGLDTYAMGYEAAFIENRNVTLNLVNFTENDIQAINYTIYSGDRVISSGGTCNADNSPVKRGEIFTVFFEHGDLGSGENVTVELCIELSDGRSFPLKDRCRVPSSDGAETTLLLTGSVKEGFRIKQ